MMMSFLLWRDTTCNVSLPLQYDVLFLWYMTKVPTHWGGGGWLAFEKLGEGEWMPLGESERGRERNITREVVL